MGQLFPEAYAEDQTDQSSFLLFLFPYIKNKQGWWYGLVTEYSLSRQKVLGLITPLQGGVRCLANKLSDEKCEFYIFIFLNFTF